MSEDSLDDLAAEASQPVQSTGQIAFMRNASQESEKRNASMGQEIWRPVWDARGKVYPFSIDKVSAAKVILLNQGIPMLAHKVFIGWIQKGGFPNRENARCRALRLDKQGNWISTNKECLLCTFLGCDPRLVVLYGLIDLRQDKKRDGKFQVRRIELDHRGVMGSIWNGVELAANREKREATTKYAMFHVSRSGERTALSLGNQWTFEKWVSPEMCADYMGLLPNWKEGYPIFPTDTLKEIARRHMGVCGDHNITENSRGAPSKEGVLAIFGTESAQAAPQSANPAPGKVGESLDDLSTESAPAEPPASQAPQQEAGPSLDDLDDIGGSKPPAQTETKSPNGGDAGTSADDYDPWMDGEV